MNSRDTRDFLTLLPGARPPSGEPQHEFLELAALAAAAIDAPSALLSLIDSQDARCDVPLGPLGTALKGDGAYRATVDDAATTLQIEDARQDLALRDRPMVLGGPGLRALLRIPLIGRDRPRGALWLLDARPRRWTPREVSLARRFAALIVALAARRETAAESFAAAQRLLDADIGVSQVTELSGVGGWRYDPKTEEMRWSRQTRRIFEIGPHFRTALDVCLGFFPAADRAALREALRRSGARGEKFELDLRIVTAKGRRRVIRAMGERCADAAENACVICGAFQDVTEQRAREAAMRAAKKEAEETRNRLNAAIDTLADGFAIYDSQDRLVVANRRYREIYAASAPAMTLGASFESVLRYGLAEGQYPEAAGREEEWLAERLRHHHSPTGVPCEQELPGERFLRIQEARSEHGDIVGLRVDITDAKRAQRRLEERSRMLEASNLLSEQRNRALAAANAEIHRHATRDPLTGLANRRSFDQGLAELAADAQEQGRMLALLHIDLDKFKAVNDTFGHAAGDAVLTTAAKRMRRQVREGDLLARLGGDEFALAMVTDADETTARSVAERIIAALQEPIALPNAGDCSVGASIGAVLASPETAPATMMERSDVALYAAKEAGRGQAAFFSDAMQRRRSAEMSCLQSLRRASESEDLRVFYERLVDARSGRLLARSATTTLQGASCGGVAEASCRFGSLFGRASSESAALCARVQLRLAGEALRGPRETPLILRLSQTALEMLDVAALTEGDAGLADAEIALDERDAQNLSDAAIAGADALLEAGASLAIRDFGAAGGVAMSLIRWRPRRVFLAERLTRAPERSENALRALIGLIQSFDAEAAASGVASFDAAERLRALGIDALQGPGAEATEAAAPRLCQGSRCALF